MTLKTGEACPNCEKIIRYPLSHVCDQRDIAKLPSSATHHRFIDARIEWLRKRGAETTLPYPTRDELAAFADGFSAASALSETPRTDDWKLMPPDATDEMVKAARIDETSGTIRGIWKDMFFAAPKPEYSFMDDLKGKLASVPSAIRQNCPRCGYPEAE